LFATYPISYLLFRLSDPKAKNFLSFIVGFLIVQWIFGPDWIHTFISSSVTYLICAFGPKKYIGIIAFVWVIGYIIGCHIFTMYTDYMTDRFDFLRTQMVITMKLTSFAYNYFDGTYDHDKVFTHEHESKGKTKIFAQRRRFAITSLPTPLEFFGYVYCFPVILVGPAFEYADYIQAINGTAYIYKGADGHLVKKIPSNFLPAFRCLVTGVINMILFLYFQPKFPIESHYEPSFIANTDMITRFGLLYMALLTCRFKFYFVWKVAEGGAVLGGFGFEGFDPTSGKEIGWQGAENIDIVAVEAADSIQAMTRNWNKRTQGWLERYTYQRLNRSLVAVYLVSAAWHGLYPGYFLAFLTLPLPTMIERLIREKINPLVIPEYNGYDWATYPKNTTRGIVYELICWIGTYACLTYAMQVFYMITWERALNAWRGYYFLGHLVMGVVLLVMMFVVPTSRKTEKTSGKVKVK
jgi:hypothetical protein